MHTRQFRAPSPALVISLIALFVALGGTTYAATSLPKNSVGTKQLKKNAVTGAKIKKGAVTAAKINAAGLTVPNALHATSANSATSATNATNATNATSATSATSATNATNLGGHAATYYAAKTLPSGQSESGGWHAETPANSIAIAGVTFPTPLASSLDGSHVVYLSSGTNAHCPGVGSAAPGYLCVYTTGDAGLTFQFILTYGSNPGADPYGAVIQFFTNGGSSGSAVGSWTVTAP